MQMNILKILNARRVTVGLSEGVTVERLISLLNERKVKVLGAELRNGLTGELLAEFVDAINTGDYKVLAEQLQRPFWQTSIAITSTSASSKFCGDRMRFVSLVHAGEGLPSM